MDFFTLSGSFLYTKVHPWRLDINCTTNWTSCRFGRPVRFDTNMQRAIGMQKQPHPRWDQIPSKGPVRLLQHTLNSHMKGTCFQHSVSLPQGHLIKPQSQSTIISIEINAFPPDWRAFQTSDVKEYFELLNSVDKIIVNGLLMLSIPSWIHWIYVAKVK